MAEPIDPYHLFLGIPPHHQPPNQYRLLGLEIFESNRQVIAEAADRQIAYVRRYESSPHAAAVQKILIELAMAKGCLLLPERKAAYDAALRKKLAAAARAGRPLYEEEELITEADPPVAQTTPAAKSPPKSGSGVGLHRAAPTTGVAANSAAPAAAPRAAAALSPATMPSPAAVPQAVGGYSPIDPLPDEPLSDDLSHLSVYQRRFLATLAKVAIFTLFLTLILIFVHSYLAPWLKESPPLDQESLEAESATSSPASENSFAPPPMPISVPEKPVVQERSSLEEEKSTVEEEKPAGRENSAEDATENETARKPVSIFKTIQTAIQSDAIQKTPCIGDGSGEAFETKEGEGVLVALKLTWKKFGKNNELRMVSSLQPEYLTSRGYVKGSVYGTPQENGLRFLARSGYAIGALKINYVAGGKNAKGKIIGLRIVFMRIQGGQFDPMDYYCSSSFPLESSVPLNAPQIGGTGDFVVGIHGTAAESDLLSLGLIHLKK